MGLLKLVCVAGLVCALAACSGSNFRRSVGLSAPPPDEFLVVSRRPLEAPPVPGALPRPQLGAPSRVEPNPEADAQAALLGDTAAAAQDGPSRSEEALLAATGANAVEPIDRSQIPEAAPASERVYGLDSFFGIEIDQNPGGDEDALASREEAERLRREGLRTPTPPPAPAQ
jgi:hypothetical protein